MFRPATRLSPITDVLQIVDRDECGVIMLVRQRFAALPRRNNGRRGTVRAVAVTGSTRAPAAASGCGSLTAIRAADSAADIELRNHRLVVRFGGDRLRQRGIMRMKR